MKINLIGEIDSQGAALKEFTTQFDEALADRSVRKIKIELCSVGGCTYSAFAIYNRIKASPKPVQIIANGFVASCAVLIFAAGHERRSYKNTTFMVHEFSSTSGYDEVSSVAFKDIKIQLAEQKNYAALLANNSLLDSAKWYKLMKRTTYFSAEQALKIGLVQEIV